MSRPLLEFVILHHEGIENPHFDLMFETYPGSTLTTWRADAWPFDHTANLTRLDDHRREYLDYEGPIRAGGRGWVRRLMRGRCSIELRKPTDWFVYFPDPSTDLPPSAFRIQQLDGQVWRATPVGG